MGTVSCSTLRQVHVRWSKVTSIRAMCATDGKGGRRMKLLTWLAEQTAIRSLRRAWRRSCDEHKSAVRDIYLKDSAGFDILIRERIWQKATGERL